MPYPSKLTPDSILQAGPALLDEGGPAALNMRPLAAALGVQASSLYRHFPDREALLQALEDAAASEFNRVLQAASSGKMPREALWAAAEAYLSYARRHRTVTGCCSRRVCPVWPSPAPARTSGTPC